MKVQGASSKVSGRSTKKEIWDAYESLLGELEEKPTSQVAKQLTSLESQLRERLQNNLSDLQKLLSNELSSIMSDFERAKDTLEQMNELQVNQSERLEQEKRDILLKRQRDEEDYQYEFDKKKKRHQEELDEMKAKAEEEIRVHKEALKLSEDELKDLRAQVASFEDQITKAVKSAVDTETKALKTEYEHERQLVEQKYSAQENLLNQTIGALRATVAKQEKELARLQSALSESSNQLTRIAERAVEKQTVSQQQ